MPDESEQGKKGADKEALACPSGCGQHNGRLPRRHQAEGGPVPSEHGHGEGKGRAGGRGTGYRGRRRKGGRERRQGNQGDGSTSHRRRHNSNNNNSSSSSSDARNNDDGDSDDGGDESRTRSRRSAPNRGKKKGRSRQHGSASTEDWRGQTSPRVVVRSRNKNADGAPKLQTRASTGSMSSRVFEGGCQRQWAAFEAEDVGRVQASTTAALLAALNDACLSSDTFSRESLEVFLARIVLEDLTQTSSATHFASFVTTAMYRLEEPLSFRTVDSVISVLASNIRKYSPKTSHMPSTSTSTSTNSTDCTEATRDGVLYQVLRALCAICFDEPSALDGHMSAVVGSGIRSGLLLWLASKENGNPHTQRLAIQCLGYICNRPCSNIRHRSLPTLVMEIVMAGLMERTMDVDGHEAYIVYKVLEASFKALTTIISNADRIQQKDVAPALAVSKKFMTLHVTRSYGEQLARFRVAPLFRQGQTGSYDPLHTLMVASQKQSTSSTLSANPGVDTEVDPRHGAPSDMADAESAAHAERLSVEVASLCLDEPSSERTSRTRSSNVNSSAATSFDNFTVRGSNNVATLTVATPTPTHRRRDPTQSRSAVADIATGSAQRQQRGAQSAEAETLEKAVHSDSAENAHTMSNIERLNAAPNKTQQSSASRSALPPKRRRRGVVRGNAPLKAQEDGGGDETELSDASPSAYVSGKSVSASQVRAQVLKCIHTIITKSSKKGLFQYWLSFFPEKYAMGDASLLTLFTTELLPKCRLLALAVATALLEACKQFLLMAEDTSGTRHAYTPQSAVTARSIGLLHHQLCDLCEKEKVPNVRVSAYKALHMLIECTPYNRLAAPLPLDITRVVLHATSAKDQPTQIAALKALSRLFTQRVSGTVLNEIVCAGDGVSGDEVPCTAPLLVALQQSRAHQTASDSKTQINGPLSDALDADGGTSDDGADDRMLTEFLHSLPSWGSCVMQTLVAQCFPPFSTHLRGEAVQTITGIVCAHISALRSIWSKLFSFAFFLANLYLTDEFILPRVLKLIEELSHFLQTTKGFEDEAAGCWRKIMASVLESAFQAKSPLIQSAACDCLSSIGSQVFSRLEVWQQRHYQALLLGLCCEGDAHVRAAAARGVGMLVLFPCLHTDPLFMTDVAEVIVRAVSKDPTSRGTSSTTPRNQGDQGDDDCACDSQRSTVTQQTQQPRSLESLSDSISRAIDSTPPVVAVRLSWALGNFTNALGLVASNHSAKISDIVTHDHLARLMEIALAYSHGVHKFRSNGLRAVGELSRILQGEQDLAMIARAVNCLAENTLSGPPKVRWNACHAAANLVQNPLLPTHLAENLGDLVQQLLDAMAESSNYKVRIGATSALHFLSAEGWVATSLMVPAIKTLMASMKSASQSATFSEFKYQQSFRHDLCISLGYLLCICKANSDSDDREQLAQTLRDEKDVVDEVLGLLRREYNIMREIDADSVQNTVGKTEGSVQAEGRTSRPVSREMKRTDFSENTGPNSQVSSDVAASVYASFPEIEAMVQTFMGVDDAPSKIK